MLAAVLQKPEEQEQVGLRPASEAAGSRCGARRNGRRICELRAAFLVERLDLFGHGVALQDAEILAQAERDAARQPGDVFRLGDIHERLQPHIDMMAKPSLDALRDVVLVDRGEVLVGKKREIGL